MKYTWEILFSEGEKVGQILIDAGTVIEALKIFEEIKPTAIFYNIKRYKF